MKKQNWFCKLVSRFCNQSKQKQIETTLKIEEEKLKYLQLKIETRVNTDSESFIKYVISTEMAKFLIDNVFINYSLFEIEKLSNSQKDKMYTLFCDFNFYVKPNKNSDNETYTFDKNTDFNSLNHMFSNPDSNFNKNTENENSKIS